jgi:hypothetical protein
MVSSCRSCRWQAAAESSLSGCWRFDHVESGGLSTGAVVLGVAALQGKRDGWEAVARGIFTGEVRRVSLSRKPWFADSAARLTGTTGTPTMSGYPERYSTCVLINSWTKSEP